MGDATLPSSRVRVSVVTPFLNAERYLKEAGASVVAQTYPHGARAPARSLLPRMLRGRVAVPCPSGVLVRAATFRRVGGFEDSFTGMYDDQAFYAKLMLAAPILVVDEALERCRQHDDSCCAC